MNWIIRFINHVQTVLGVPNYDHYVTYMQKYHPEQTIQDKKTFYQQRLNARYEGGKINRCC